MIIQRLSAAAFRFLSFVGRPFGGVRPRRIYSWLARRAFTAPHFNWVRNRWGHELFLSPYYFLDRAIIFGGTYSADVHLLFERIIRPGMVCMDIGANIGEMSLHLAKLVGPDGAVYAFEPVVPLFDRLKLNVERNGLDGIVRCFKLAVSNKSGYLPLRYADSSKENQGMASLVDDVPSVLNLCDETRTVTLDDFIREHELDRIDFIKADIQGAEVYMLEGGSTCFGNLCPDVLMEIAPSCLKKIGKTAHDLMAQVNSYGYDTFTIKKGRIKQRIGISEELQTDRGTNVFCTTKAEHRSSN